MLKHQFKDTEGRVWTLSITVREYMAIKKEHGVDIGEIFDPKSSWIQELVAQDNMELFLGILGTITDPEREKQELSMEDFYGGLGGDVLGDAAGALIEAIVNFTPAHKRGALRKIVESTEQVLETLHTRVMEEMDKEMENLDEKMDEIIKS